MRWGERHVVNNLANFAAMLGMGLYHHVSFLDILRELVKETEKKKSDKIFHFGRIPLDTFRYLWI